MGHGCHDCGVPNGCECESRYKPKTYSGAVMNAVNATMKSEQERDRLLAENRRLRGLLHSEMLADMAYCEACELAYQTAQDAPPQCPRCEQSEETKELRRLKSRYASALVAIECANTLREAIDWAAEALEDET